MGKLEKLAMAALRADIEKKEAERRAAAAKEDFIAALKQAGKYTTDTTAVGNVRTKIQNNRYFDIEKAERLAGEEAVKASQVTSTDAKILKAHMKPNDVEAAMVQYEKNPLKLSLAVLED